MQAKSENMMACFNEFYRLIDGHWEELALDKDEVKLDPLWEVYAAREAAGELLFVSLRKDGHMIGYFIAFIAPGLHYRHCLTATMDIFYIHPKHRGGTAALRLFRETLREMKRRGVRRAFLGSKLHKDAGRLFKAFGFEPIETYYSRLL